MLLLSIITLGIYIPFWFRRNKKVTDTFPQEKKLSGGLISLLIFLTIAMIFTAGKLTLNGKVYTLNYYGIKHVFRYAELLLIIFLSFNLRSVLQSQFSANLNPILTFFLGPLYLQHKINSILEKQSVQQYQPLKTQAQNVFDPRTQQLANYIRTQETQGYTPQQIRAVLIQQGYSTNELDEAFRRVNI